MAFNSSVISTIIRVGQSMGYGPREITAALSTGIVESGLRNLNYGDRDSLGVFQQRPSQGWGSPSQVMNVDYAARQFYSRIPQFDRPGISGAELAARIQRPAKRYRGRYGQVWGQASQLYNQSGSRGAGSDRRFLNQAPTGRVPIGMNRTSRRRMVRVNPSPTLNMSNFTSQEDPISGDPTVDEDMDMWSGILSRMSRMMSGEEGEPQTAGQSFRGTGEEETDFGLKRALGELYQRYGPSKQFLADFDLTEADLDDLPAPVRQATLQMFGGLPPKPGQGSGSTAVQIAQKYLGVPYLWGGTNPQRGLDCSGLLQLVYKQMGVNLPRVSADQAKAGSPVNGLANAKAGDLLYKPGHIAMYIGGGKMIHAPRTGKNVEIRDVYFQPTTIRRIV